MCVEATIDKMEHMCMCERTRCESARIWEHVKVPASERVNRRQSERDSVCKNKRACVA